MENYSIREMKITIPDYEPYSLIDLYQLIAREIKADATEVNFDCRKINIAANIQDKLYEYYAKVAREIDPDINENDIKIGITMLLAMSGPKIDGTLKANEVEVFDGFIC